MKQETIKEVIYWIGSDSSRCTEEQAKELIEMVLKLEGKKEKPMNKNIEETMEKTKNLNLYEIYVCNSEDIHDGMYEGKLAGEITGWDIHWVLASSEDALEDYPFFDCVITTNDNSTGRRLGAIIWK